jgi:hypothetical protein
VKTFDQVRVDSPLSSFHGRKGYVTDVEDTLFGVRVRLECGIGVWFDPSELEAVCLTA